MSVNVNKAVQAANTVLLNQLTELVDELVAYDAVGSKNATQARRIRKATLNLEKQFKPYRKLSVSAHTKVAAE
jgi:hypothetical protein